jgi:hypothetical protein
MYALTASAAGVSLLALTQPSEAKVVYTRTQQVIGRNGVYELDLNHDGTIDFLIEQSSYVLRAQEALGNAVQGNVGYSWNLAAALDKGARIGRGQGFVKGNGEALVAIIEHTSGTHTTGHWVNVKNRYLGLKFKIRGVTHYGWARLSVHVQGDNITGTLTGYAYETIANKGINAGQTNGKADNSTARNDAFNFDAADLRSSSSSPASDTQRSASLGSLALGVTSLSLGGQ